MCIVSCRDLPVVKAETKSQVLDIDSVPNNIVLLFFSYLNAQELCVVSRVKKQWSLLATTEGLWKNLVTCNLGFEINLNDTPVRLWKESYIIFLDIFIVRKIALMQKQKESEHYEVSNEVRGYTSLDNGLKVFFTEKLKVIELRISKDILSLAKKMSANFKKKHFNLTELASNTENYPFETVRIAGEIMDKISILDYKNRSQGNFSSRCVYMLAKYIA